MSMKIITKMQKTIKRYKLIVCGTTLYYGDRESAEKSFEFWKDYHDCTNVGEVKLYYHHTAKRAGYNGSERDDYYHSKRGIGILRHLANKQVPTGSRNCHYVEYYFERKTNQLKLKI